MFIKLSINEDQYIIFVAMHHCVLVPCIFIKSREYERTLLEYVYSHCTKLGDRYTLNEKAGLYLAANGEWVFNNIVQ